MDNEKAWQPLELVKVSAEYLAGKKCHSPRLDAEVLLCNVLGLERRVDLYAGFERKISGKELAAYRELIRRRAAREPVSRILGQRDFMGLSFTVTPDVLSPRPETEILVETALEKLRPPRKFDVAEEEPAQAEYGMEAEPEANEGTIDPEVSDALERLLDSYAADVDSEDELDEDGSAESRASAKRPEGFSTEPAQGAKTAPSHFPGMKSASALLHNTKDVNRQTRSMPRKGSSLRSGSGEAEGQGPVTVLDLGTGSGCIASSIASLLYRAQVVAVDASPKALQVAKKNAAKLGVVDRITFRQGDWFSACNEGERFDMILSNPPYLIEGDGAIWPEVSGYDPPLALYGGRDGLDCYRRIIPSAPDWLKPEGWILFEVGAGQAETVADMLKRRGFREVSIVKDYGGISRVVAAKSPEE